MKKNDIKAAALVLCGMLTLCGCSQKPSNELTTQSSSNISSVDSSTENSNGSSAVSSVFSSGTFSYFDSESTSVSSSDMSCSTTTTSSSSTTTNEPMQSAISSASQAESEPSSEWAESSYSAVMYVNSDCYSRVKPILGFTKAKLYHINDKVNVVAKTNTDFYKLDNGEFIHVDYLSTSKITIQSYSSKISSSSGSTSRSDDIVYIDIGPNTGRPLSDFFN